MVQILLGYTIRVLPSRPIYLTRLSPPLFSVLRTHRSALCSLLSEWNLYLCCFVIDSSYIEDLSLLHEVKLGSRLCSRHSWGVRWERRERKWWTRRKEERKRWWPGSTPSTSTSVCTAGTYTNLSSVEPHELYVSMYLSPILFALWVCCLVVSVTAMMN